MAVLAYNRKANATTGISPFEAFLGRRAKLPIDLIIPVPDKQYRNEDDFVRETQRRFHSMFNYMKKNADATFHWNAKLYTGNTKSYAIGELVWVFCKQRITGKPLKLTDNWTGPYRIVSIPAEV